MKTYVILGAGCCFAQHTALYLLDRLKTERVVGIGRHGINWNHKLNIGDHDRYSFIVQDIRKTDELMSVLHSIKPQVIINFAAEGESGASFTDSAKYFDTNATASVRMVECLHLAAPWLQRFVQVSTGEVYGSTDCPAYESDPVNPTSPYAASKAAFDHFLVAYHKRRGFPFNIVRPANTYGQGQQLYRIIPKAIMCGLTGKQLPLYGNGMGEKSYMHVSDMASGIVKVATQAPLGRIYNLSPRMPTKTRDMVLQIAKLLNIPAPQLFKDEGLRRGTDKRYWLDAKKAHVELGWQVETPLEMGLYAMIAWHKRHLEFLTAQMEQDLKREPKPQPVGV